MPISCNSMGFRSIAERALAPVEVAYETYGALNEAKSNAILILHAFSGDAHAAGISPQTGKPGWWDNMIGPGKAFDTNQYFVICSNVLGGCRGTTGPSLHQPGDRAAPTPCRFPVITIGDMVRLQKMLIDHLGIRAAAGGDRRLDGRHAGARMGGFLSRRGGLRHSHRHHGAPLARSRSRSTRWAGRPSWRTRTGTSGDYYGGQAPGARPRRGPHGGPHHLHERRLHAREVRPPSARQRELRLRTSTWTSKWRATCATAAASS